MVRSPTVGVLSPFIGGAYYGGILTGIAHAVAAVGGRVVALQTLEAGSPMADLCEAPETVPRVAWDHVDGFIVIVDAVEGEQVAAYQAAGRPVVAVSHRCPGLEVPTVLSDNRAGIREAVCHLVDHGHRRIAFAGYVSADDIRERYTAYRETLQERGIPPDPALFFAAPDCHESGGAEAAKAMIGAGMPSTAVVCATDLNAIGLMRTLTAAGHALPRDQAIVGFDDIDAAAYLSPSLATVRQLLGVMGGMAVNLLTRQLAGETVPTGPHRVATGFVRRASCGCTRVLAPVSRTGTADAPRDELAVRLTGLLPESSNHRSEDSAALATGAAAIADTVEKAAADPSGAANDPAVLTDDGLVRALTELYLIRPQPESLALIAEAIQWFAERVAPAAIRDGPAVGRAARCVQDMMLVLAQAQGRAQFGDNSHFRVTVSAQYEVSMDLLHRYEQDPRTLGWLAITSARGGCLGLWASADRSGSGRPPVDDLEVVGTYARDAEPAPTGWSTVRSFPPKELLALVEGTEDVVFVVPAKVKASDWGLLAVVGAVETRVQNGRETMNQCAALLTVALDLRDQERRLRRAAMFDGLTGLPNRTLFIDRLRQAVGRARRQEDYGYALLFVDLNGFKEINDTFGHAAGDRLLICTAERIQANLRDVDTAGRFGGDEFLVLLDGIGDWATVRCIAKRLGAALSQSIDLDGRPVRVGASTGIALSSAGYLTAEDVLRAADAAMYRQKVARRRAAS